MSQENVEVVQRAFLLVQESLRRGNPGSSFDDWVREGLIAPGLEWKAGTRAGMGVAGIDDFAGRDGYVESRAAGPWTSRTLRSSRSRSSTPTTIT